MNFFEKKLKFGNGGYNAIVANKFAIALILPNMKDESQHE